MKKETKIDKKYPVAIFELIPLSRTGSGFVREDTRELPDDQKVRIIHPKNRVIMSTSIERVESKEEPGTFINKPTRYIYNQQVTDFEKQVSANMTTSVRDKIVFINGFLTVPKDGAFVGLYKFMMEHAQNATNPNRVESLQVIFRQIKPSAEAHDKNILDLKIGQAMGIIMKLVKEKGGSFEYDEERIDALCIPFGVVAESPSQQAQALIAIAKTRPVEFLEFAKKSEQTISIEIKHALQLKLIKIEGTGIFYTEGEEKIKAFSNAQNTDEKKLAGLASYYQKEEGKEAYDLFKEKLAAAKEKAVAET